MQSTDFVDPFPNSSSNTTIRTATGTTSIMSSSNHPMHEGSENTATNTTNATISLLNQEKVHQRVSRIYPFTDTLFVAKAKKTPMEVKFHPLTSHFVNQKGLEKLYQVTFARENAPRSSRIVILFLFLYLLFTGSNFLNLFSKDKTIADKAQEYCIYVFAPLAPLPFLMYLGRTRKYERHFQKIYTAMIMCWLVSILSGGMYSMLTEWKNYLENDMQLVLKAININASTNEGEVFYLDETTKSGKDDHFTGQWSFKPINGTRTQILRQYTQDLLLPAATMNINMLRVIMIFVLVPLLRIDTMHFTLIALVTCIAYNVLTFQVYPASTSVQFTQNRVLVLCFPILFALVMVLRNRDVDRVIRQDFLHVWAVELEAEKATREKNLIAEENRHLKKELAKRDDDFALDLTSPLHSLLGELKTFMDDADLTEQEKVKGKKILKNLAKLDTNLFMPDIRAQMKNEKNDVDKDTKNWALSVLAKKEYTGTGRTTTTMSVSSHSNSNSNSNSDTRKSYQEGMNMIMQTISPLQNMPSWQEDALQKVKQKIQEEGWNLNTLQIAEMTENQPLLYVTVAMFEIHDLYEEFRIDRVVLRNFLYLIDEGYLNNPYHNTCHAADVVNSVNYLMTTLSDGHIRETLTNLEFYAALIAAAVHDFRHPGKSNNYMIKSKHDLAIQYNDRSILESMHLAETFFVCKNPACDIFGRMKEKPYREIRKAIIEMVLSTDLSMHLQLVGNLKTLVLQEKNNDIPSAPGTTAASDPMMMMKVVIKCADIGHAAKERKLHVVWSSLIIEEFFLQGDSERANNADISPFMDRYSENSAKNQVGFFEFIVLPFYETVSQVIFEKEFSVIHNIAKHNYSLWKEADRRGHTSIVAIKKEVFLNDAIQ